jgi:HD superfamily phosphohydrolase
LGQTHLVYRGATHKRLEHSIGTLHVATLFIEALDRNAGPEPPDPDDRSGEWALGGPLTPAERAFVRLGSLLHDVGHLPAGHTFEDELGLLPAHDGQERLNLVLDRTEWYGASYSTTLRSLIDRLFAGEASASGLTTEGRPLTGSEVFSLLVSKDFELPDAKSNADFRLDVCRNIIGNTICADLLDYLHRDWLHVGKPRYFDTRLFEYTEIRVRETDDGPEAHLVINLRGGNRVRTDAVTGILDLLESRYQLFEIALFHRTKLCAAAMLERAVAEVADAYSKGASAFLAGLPSTLLDRSDEEMLSLLEGQATESSNETTESGAKLRLAGAASLFHKLRLRELHKELRTAYEYNLADVALDVQDRYAGPQAVPDRMERAQSGARNRLAALRLLEADFGMPAGSIVMYCPPRGMSTKIAEVEVLIHSHVHTLDRFERTHGDQGVTGGHLRAQEQRFRRLWRILFAIDPKERLRLEEANLLQALGRAIDLCVLRVSPSVGTIDDAVVSLAAELTAIEKSPLYEMQVVEETAARGETLLSYPGGTRSLLSCVK